MPPRLTDRDAVQTAVADLEQAEAAVTEALRERDEADDALDRALAERGWRRSFGGFNARLYERAATPGYLVPREDVLRAIELERRGAA